MSRFSSPDDWDETIKSPGAVSERGYRRTLAPWSMGWPNPTSFTHIAVDYRDRHDARVTGSGENGVVAHPINRAPELLVGFDTETTGLDVRSERAISYGFCIYRYGQPVEIEEFFVVPDRPISDGARRVHGLDVERLNTMRSTHVVLDVAAGARRAIEVLTRYHEAGAYVVGANVVRFDLAMLRHTANDVLEGDNAASTFEQTNFRIIDVIEHDLVIDPSRVFRPRRSLSHLCSHYNVKPGDHDAVGDARAAVEVLLEQIVHNNAGQRELSILPPDHPVKGA